MAGVCPSETPLRKKDIAEAEAEVEMYMQKPSTPRETAAAAGESEGVRPAWLSLCPAPRIT